MLILETLLISHLTGNLVIDVSVSEKEWARHCQCDPQDKTEGMGIVSVYLEKGEGVYVGPRVHPAGEPYDILPLLSKRDMSTVSNRIFAEIPPSDLGLNAFKGMYRLTVELKPCDCQTLMCRDPERAVGVVADMSPYYECLGRKIKNLRGFNECQPLGLTKMEMAGALRMNVLITAFRGMVLGGYHEEAWSLQDLIEKACVNDCDDCGPASKERFGQVKVLSSATFGTYNGTVIEV